LRRRHLTDYSRKVTAFDAWSEAARLVAGRYVQQTRGSATVTAVLNDIEVRAVGGLSFSLLHLTRVGHTDVRAVVPDLAEVTIHVRERRQSPPRGLTRVAIEDEPRVGLAEDEPAARGVPARFAVRNGPPSFAEERGVYASDEDLARLVLSPEVRRTLVDEELESYDFVMDRGEVRARHDVLERDSEVLAKVMRAVGDLAARPSQLAAQWAELARALGGVRPEPATWRLAASDPIVAIRNTVTMTIRAHIASPGPLVEAGLYTEYTCTPGSPSAPFVLSARDWDGPLPRDGRPTSRPLGLDFVDQHFALFQILPDDVDATRRRCRDLLMLARSQARFVIVDADRVSLWVPGLVLEAEAAEAALRATAALAGAADISPYR
jgi:hypothetical protein